MIDSILPGYQCEQGMQCEGRLFGRDGARSQGKRYVDDRTTAGFSGAAPLARTAESRATYAATAGVACVSATGTASLPMMMPVFGPPFAVYAQAGVRVLAEREFLYLQVGIARGPSSSSSWNVP